MRCVIDRRLLVHNRADNRVLGYDDCDAPRRRSALKTIDPKAFQAVVDAAAEEADGAGAMVLLRTPQGNFDAAVGTTELGPQTPPTADTHFRIASNTKTMTSALIVLLAQDGKLKFSDPGVGVRPERAQRREHHHRRAFEDAQWALQLHG